MQVIHGCLIVTLNGDLYDDYVRQLQKGVLEKVKATCAKEVLIDVSQVRVIDSVTFAILEDTVRMVTMLGAKVVFVGFQAGVASALVDLDVEFDDILTAVTIEDGFELLRSDKSTELSTNDMELSDSTESIDNSILTDPAQWIDSGKSADGVEPTGNCIKSLTTYGIKSTANCIEPLIIC
ncbi:MAG: STAS domain-containing protein [Desulfamplus sp.]|nr:STAS domain-containing protein [Desulfamplus sp.]